MPLFLWLNPPLEATMAIIFQKSDWYSRIHLAKAISQNQPAQLKLSPAGVLLRAWSPMGQIRLVLPCQGELTLFPKHRGLELDRLDSLLKSMDKDEKIHLEWGEKHLHLKSGRSRFKLSFLDSGVIPTKERSSAMFTIQSDIFADRLERLSTIAPKQDSRSMLNGIFLRNTDGKLELVASDGRRLGKAVLPVLDRIEAKKLAQREGILGSAQISILSQFLDLPGHTETDVSLRPGFAEFSQGDERIWLNLIDMPYIDYQRAIPESSSGSCKISGQQLASVIKQIAPLAQGDIPKIAISFPDGNNGEDQDIHLETVVEAGKADELAEADTTCLEPQGSGVRIYLDAGLLQDAGKVMHPEETWHFDYRGPNSPLKIVDDSGILYLVMGMRVSTTPA